MLMGLPLLPRDCFEEGYEYIMQQARELGLFNQLRSIFEYFQFWIQEVRRFFRRIYSTVFQMNTKSHETVIFESLNDSKWTFYRQFFYI